MVRRFRAPSDGRGKLAAAGELSEPRELTVDEPKAAVTAPATTVPWEVLADEPKRPGIPRPSFLQPDKLKERAQAWAAAGGKR